MSAENLALKNENHRLKQELENIKHTQSQQAEVVEQIKIEMRGKDNEIARLRREAYGVEVHDVDGGVTRVVDVGGGGGGAGAEADAARSRGRGAGGWSTAGAAGGGEEGGGGARRGATLGAACLGGHKGEGRGEGRGEGSVGTGGGGD